MWATRGGLWESLEEWAALHLLRHLRAVHSRGHSGDRCDLQAGGKQRPNPDMARRRSLCISVLSCVTAADPTAFDQLHQAATTALHHPNTLDAADLCDGCGMASMGFVPLLVVNQNFVLIKINLFSLFFICSGYHCGFLREQFTAIRCVNCTKRMWFTISCSIWWITWRGSLTWWPSWTPSRKHSVIYSRWSTACPHGDRQSTIISLCWFKHVLRRSSICFFIIFWVEYLDSLFECICGWILLFVQWIFGCDWFFWEISCKKMINSSILPDSVYRDVKSS